MGTYKDILNKEYPNRETEKDFPDKVNRAAQFAPYAALVGFEDIVHETARLTERKIEPDENQKEIINRNICYVKDNIEQNIKVDITYFVKDELKAGGSYVQEKVVIDKIREFEKEIVLADGRVVEIGDIVSFNVE